MKYRIGDATKYDIIKGYEKNGYTFFLDDFESVFDKHELPLKEKHLRKLIYVVSSRCTTTPSFVSTQDRLTMGYRRLAVSTLNRLLKENYNITIDDAIKDDYKLAIEISDDPRWLEIQFLDHMKSLKESLARHNFKMGREIALYERIKNSAPAWLSKLPKDYEEMKQIYIDKKGKKGKERVEEIEKAIPAQEVWR